MLMKCHALLLLLLLLPGCSAVGGQDKTGFAFLTLPRFTEAVKVEDVKKVLAAVPSAECVSTSIDLTRKGKPGCVAIGVRFDPAKADIGDIVKALTALGGDKRQPVAGRKHPFWPISETGFAALKKELAEAKGIDWKRSDRHTWLALDEAGGAKHAEIEAAYKKAAPLLLAFGADRVRKDLQDLQGTWKTVAGEARGTPFPMDGIPDFSFIVAADGKSTGKTPQEEFQFTITVDPNRKPKAITNHHTSGKQKGKAQYGIYKLEGDRFTVCMTRPGAEENDRPRDFATKDTTNVVFVFERVKADKSR